MTTPPFDVKKNLEDAIKEGLVIAGATVGIFWLLKMGKIASPPKAALDASDIIKISGGVITGALLSIRSGYDEQQVERIFLWFIKAIKNHCFAFMIGGWVGMCEMPQLYKRLCLYMRSLALFFNRQHFSTTSIKISYSIF